MGRLFEVFDVRSEGDPEVSDEFRLSESTPSNYLILRLILGSVSITNLETEESINISRNYVSLFYEYDEAIAQEQNLCRILNESIDVGDLKEFIFNTRYRQKNTGFFNRLLNEFCNFLLYQEKGSYTTAFVFIYRILEVISYSFPLIYASNTYDFKHSYGALKEMFSANSAVNKGELGFFKSAIRVMFKESDFSETSIDINLDEEEFEKRKKIYNAIMQLFSRESIFHPDSIENSKLAINFGDVSSFIIGLRNRFFHLFNRGERNLESSELIDPDYFFSKMNAPLFSWICVVFLEVNKFLLEEHAKYMRY